MIATPLVQGTVLRSSCKFRLWRLAASQLTGSRANGKPTPDTRQTPAYLAYHGENRNQKASYMIWLANTLSTHSCHRCKQTGDDCWVSENHVKCARCTWAHRHDVKCGARGVKSTQIIEKCAFNAPNLQSTSLPLLERLISASMAE